MPCRFERQHLVDGPQVVTDIPIDACVFLKVLCDLSQRHHHALLMENVLGTSREFIWRDLGEFVFVTTRANSVLELHRVIGRENHHQLVLMIVHERPQATEAFGVFVQLMKHHHTALALAIAKTLDRVRQINAEVITPKELLDGVMNEQARAIRERLGHQIGDCRFAVAVGAIQHQVVTGIISRNNHLHEHFCVGVIENHFIDGLWGVFDLGTNGHVLSFKLVY